NWDNNNNPPQVSMRGNKFIGLKSPPVSHVPYSTWNGSGGQPFTNYYGRFMFADAANTNNVIPVLSSSTTPTSLIGTCTTGIFPYTNIIIDVYVADAEGQINGKKFGFASETNGFMQGLIYKGSFVDNGPFDSNPAIGAFTFDTTAASLDACSTITVTANYSIDPPGTHRGRTHTSPF